MKKLKSNIEHLKFVIISSLLAICLFAGCQESQQTEQSSGAANASTVIIPEGATFPKQMIGVWEDKTDGWIMRIEEDGRLSKLRHTIGRRNLVAGQRSEFPLVDDGKGFMQPGPWQVEYIAETDEIAIDTSLVSFEFDVPSQGVISGSARDTFIGKVPQPGETVWKALWLSNPDFVATTTDKAYEDHKLPMGPNDEDRGEIVFEKVDLSKPQPSHDHKKTPHKH